MPFVVPPLAAVGLEELVLDGLDLNDYNLLRLQEVAFPPPRQRQDWIGAADSEWQALMRNPLHENREITLKIRVTQAGDMDAALSRIAGIVDKLQAASETPDGIELTWSPKGSNLTVTFDVLDGEITEMPMDWEGWLLKSPTVTVVLKAKPYWRGTETLTSMASTSTPFVTLAITNSIGDVPALGRLIVTDLATQSRRHVEWGLEGPLTYNAATSLLIDSDDMVTTGFAGAQQAGTGYDPNASGNTQIFVTNLPSAPVAVCGLGNLSHVGAFRVKARLSIANSATKARLSWRVADGPMTSNAWAPMSQPLHWEEVDLGMVTIPPVLAGTQRWTGQIEVLTTAAGDTINVDYLSLIPVSAGYGKARAQYSYTAGVSAGYDAFTGTTAGNNLNARVAPAGGTWATSGVATDFQFADDLSGEQVKRSTVAEAATGRMAILGSTNYSDTEVGVTINVDALALGANVQMGVYARWVDASNHLRAYVIAGYNQQSLILGSTVATVEDTVALTLSSPVSVATNYKLRLIAFSSGRAIAQWLDSSGALLDSLSYTSSALAAGGALDDGKPGIYDANRSSGGLTPARRYDDFYVAIPAAEPIVIYSGRNMQIRHDDVIRQDSTGTYTARPQSYRGSRFLAPVGTSRLLVKARRNDTEVTADDNVTDSTQIQVAITPRGLVVPRA